MKDNEMGSGNFRRRLKKLSSKIFRPQLPLLRQGYGRQATLNILDLGTGSGCLGISLLKELQQAIDSRLVTIDCFLSDISPSALRIARKNARALLATETMKQFNNSTIHFVHSDLFTNRLLHKKFDLILANLPYVPNSDISSSNSVKYEPSSAIFANDNGAAIIKNFLTISSQYLADHALILIELDPRNAKPIEKFARKIYPHAKIELKKDLAGLDRYLTIQL
jgi:release factor glutamine methyltransferase